MKSSLSDPIVAAILGNEKKSKSVICSVLAFLEAVERDASSPIRQVQARVVNANGISGQGTLVPLHLERFGLPSDNFKGDLSGRKTPNAQVVIPRLVQHLESQGFELAEPIPKLQMLHEVSEKFRAILGLSLGPMKITRAGKANAAVIEEVLYLAEQRGIASAIAELLVGSKLEVCLGAIRGADIAKQHKWENGRDDPNALGDYRIENVAIEVTMVARPDETHRSKAKKITVRGTDECWLLVRSDKIKAWQDFLAKSPSKYDAMIRCYGICEFVGQNLTETLWRSVGPSDPLKEVIAKLNDLVRSLGAQHLPAARVELED